MHIGRKKNFPNLGSQSLTPLRDRAIRSILPMGTSPCKGERLASTYRLHHFTLYAHPSLDSASKGFDSFAKCEATYEGGREGEGLA